eukprot:TRINITY_DN15243_c0_g4_i1.p2 TRINITY_DN15243_c0_g4~~TRINITY_DN15243_c0_g4_i1.p2  ORF type:complete len:396 (+),score=107.36 TRINITY_DN15243_c0_g4_i1:115-1188(+)
MPAAGSDDDSESSHADVAEEQDPNKRQRDLEEEGLTERERIRKRIKALKKGKITVEEAARQAAEEKVAKESVGSRLREAAAALAKRIKVRTERGGDRMPAAYRRRSSSGSRGRWGRRMSRSRSRGRGRRPRSRSDSRGRRGRRSRSGSRGRDVLRTRLAAMDREASSSPERFRRVEARKEREAKDEDIKKDRMSYHTGGGRGPTYRLPPPLHDWKNVEKFTPGAFGPGSSHLVILCHRCGANGHLSRDCPNMECNACGEKGHMAGNCPYMVCNACGKPGHMARTCPEAKCKACGELGHTARDCDSLICHQCGGHGHMVRDCPLGAQHGFAPFTPLVQVQAPTAPRPGFNLRVNLPVR